MRVISFYQALALVDEETRRYRPTKNYLEHLPPLELSAFEVRTVCMEIMIGVCNNYGNYHVHRLL
jgi:hypothetical protein